MWIDSGELFVGDLNPLYELDLHKGTQIEKSWNRLLKLKPGTVYYGHAKTADLSMEHVPHREDYEMKNEEGKVMSVGTTSHAFLNTDGKPIRMKQEFPELYETLCGLVVQET